MDSRGGVAVGQGMVMPDVDLAVYIFKNIVNGIVIGVNAIQALVDDMAQFVINVITPKAHKGGVGENDLFASVADEGDTAVFAIHELAMVTTKAIAGEQ